MTSGGGVEVGAGPDFSAAASRSTGRLERRARGEGTERDEGGGMPSVPPAR
ncbi:MAG: hypothetical protein IPM79_16025 [Polyangiaceae bacterium]|nr:hypothetical protein [Polyangiaceae bacterium]